jgi:predicted glycosyltransferase
LGPGNRKDVLRIGRGLIDEVKKRGYTVVWAQAPISFRDVALPADVMPIRLYPLVRYLRAFDVYVGAAGYNSCCEVLQAGLPALFVPNTLVSDDQSRRATLVAGTAPAVVSTCESAEQRERAINRLMELRDSDWPERHSIELGGAQHAADEILALIGADDGQ